MVLFTAKQIIVCWDLDPNQRIQRIAVRLRADVWCFPLARPFVDYEVFVHCAAAPSVGLGKKLQHTQVFLACAGG